MAPIPPLFKIPVPSNPHSPSTAGNQGNFICTQPKPQVYLLSFSSLPDNRLTPQFINTFLLALDAIEHRLPKGVVVTTSSITKFYSNGLDYENAIKDPTFFKEKLFPLWRRLITYPMPTIALINGHAFAGGLMTAMYHDYRIMNPSKGFLCLNELDFGAVLHPTMASIFRVKLAMSTFRDMILEGKRYPAQAAAKEGIVDGTGGPDEVLAFIEERKLTVKAQSTAYGEVKEELYREVIKDLDQGIPQKELSEVRAQYRKRQAQEAEKSLEQHQILSGSQRPKL